MSEIQNDVSRQELPSVIREMIRHEDDVTNHRVMWLLVGQGFLANAFVSIKTASVPMYLALSLGGIFVTLSAFAMLYSSYQARGYLRFLGWLAKQGRLEEGQLPLVGWPEARISDWWKRTWTCRWFRRMGDLSEPWFYLPILFMFIWFFIFFEHIAAIDRFSGTMLAAVFTIGALFATCFALASSDGAIPK